MIKNPRENRSQSQGNRKQEEEKMKIIINYIGEEIEHDLLKIIGTNLMTLSKEKIDGLWHSCGWIEEGKGKNKALSDKILSKIKKEKQYAVDRVTWLFQESRKKEFLNKFKRFVKRK